jgi:putative ABC transport system substrate-binding protein
MRRREFLWLISGTVAWPIAARAAACITDNRLSRHRISSLVREPFTSFREGLSEIGYVEGQNVAIEYRWAEGQYYRLGPLAAELVSRQVTVIAAPGTYAAARAAKAATATIPIIFYAGVDPVAVGLVASLNRPGGNLTGVSDLSAVNLPKRLELLHELLPRATVVGLLADPTNPASDISESVQEAARNLGLQLHVLHASTERDFDTVFAALTQLRAGGLVIGSALTFTTRSEQLAALTLRHAVPTIFQFREFVAAGGLMSYGGDVLDAHRQVGVYTGRILKGERPADLPVQQSTKVQLFINLKTAKALGIAIPATLLARADEVIE